MSAMHRDFVVDSKKAIHIKLIRFPSDLQDDSISFHPKMTHQMINKEAIHGYKDLRINVYYVAGTLTTYLGYHYSEICNDDIVEPDNIMKLIGSHLDSDLSCNLDLFTKTIDEKFTPFGVCISKFKVHIDDTDTERNFEVFSSNALEEGYAMFMKRFSAFLLWFIDAANSPNADDMNWKIFLLYEQYTTGNQEPGYAVAGYISVYEYYGYPEHKRPRISQVLILPPYQSMGLCPKLLLTVYKYYWSLQHIIDIPVEEPGEQFQRVRDYVDSSLCMQLPCFSRAELSKGFSQEMYRSANFAFKLTKKQVERVFQILWYRIIDVYDRQEYSRYKVALRSTLQKQLENRKRKASSVKPRTPFVQDSQTTSEEDPMEILSRAVKNTIVQYSKVVQRLNEKILDID